MPSLELWITPRRAVDLSSTVRAAAATVESRQAGFRGLVIEAEFFTHPDATAGENNDLPLDADVRVATVIESLGIIDLGQAG